MNNHALQEENEKNYLTNIAMRYTLEMQTAQCVISEVIFLRSNNIAYDNLRAEMARRNIGVGNLAKMCGYNRDTLSRKLSKKSPLNLDDAFKIQRTAFPESDIRYLFDDANEPEQRKRA